ncbi:class I SAM-dependent methyltransferase [Pseudonocardia zijingensis]|uniref:Methyltransferase type 11 domain-containing protein n=1 Tax=Pseudonocardia zijingensis TaxID=153376 RepID=A0ABN1PRX1_9PSEU
MIHEHPLAYLLGVEGIALLRGFTGEYYRDFVEARLDEVRALLADESLAGAAVAVERVDTVNGYRVWSATYDNGNAAFDVDEPVVTEILDGIPPGAAVDAACGTGRMSALLAARGHSVIGVDSSPDMLARARANVPTGDFRSGDLTRLPVGDACADVVTCSLALTHVPDLRPVFAEFGRVLRPSGHLVISDMHPERILRGAIPTLRDAAGRPGRLPGHRHLVGDYLRAALAHGLELRRCEEPVLEAAAPGRRASDPGPWEAWPWSLAALVPEATRAADAGIPVEIIWHFQRGG